ncbi:MAG TPA: substrate-binding domain-containing protein [Acidimicrobiales bacterium]|nr:substrate-binding domain-containing protein [Acidimicrobiales bacterium]
MLARVSAVIGASFVACSSLLLTNVTAASAAAALNGGGSGFAGLEISQWQADVASPAHGGLQINFSSQSSGIGRQYFASNTWDFGASDIKYIVPAENQYLSQMQSGRCGGTTAAQCFVYVPVSAGGLGFMYNLSDSSGSRATDLKLTPAQVCQIFTGAISSWGQLAGSLNPWLSGSTQTITPVVRQDEAGESYVLSQYCIAEDPADWNTFVKFQDTAACTGGQDYTSIDAPYFAAGEPIPIWPSILEGCKSASVASGADGVANTVEDPSQGPGSITYDAAGYAEVRQFPNAYVENAAGDYTLPNAQSVTVALEYASPIGDGTFKLDFSESSGADPRAYNPSTYSYILAQTANFALSKGQTLSQFLCYAIGAGQGRAAQLLYAPLSTQVEDIGLTAIEKIPGAPPGSTCLAHAVSSAPPPLHKVTPVVTPGSPGGTSTGTGSTSGTSSSGTGSSGTSSGAGSTTGSQVAGSSGSHSSAGTSSSGGKQLGSGSTNASSSTGNGTSETTEANASAALAATHSPTNYDALWSILEGAGLCAVGVAFAGLKSRS